MKRFLLVFLAVMLLEILFYFSPHKYLPDPEGEILQTQDIDTLDIKFDGHIYVKANIHDDTIGYWFMFDTGAS